ncbi:lysozyme [Brevundimonas sp.]|uniref:lysozyme n=1 Tax=Brevundimonas sp. TaxID=1871086 RepID=UPI002488BA3A|nr:lysozyme [Brevundimonas sp.]MDI1282289.1 glycoside hydrolase family protein [Brevundimonas sp.]
MKVSREGVILIKSFVGFRSKAVPGEDGRWVIGYGHTASAREGLTVAEADAELLLQYDLMPVVKGINQGVTRPVNQHQFDALASFALSIGVERFLGSDVLQRVNDGLLIQAADALIGWPAPVPLDAATRRRVAERALFNADPDRPVHLADLLTAPLAPVVEPQDTDVPPVAATAARAAAVATLLGEPAVETDEPAPDATPGIAAPEIDTGAAPSASTDAASQPAEPAVEPKGDPAADAPSTLSVAPPVTGAMQFQRYSPYSAGIVGPLPGLTTVPATPPVPTLPAETTAPVLQAAAVAMSIKMAVVVQADGLTDTGPVVEPAPEPSVAAAPVTGTAAPDIVEPTAAAAVTVTLTDDTVVQPFAAPAPVAAPFGGPPLVLTALDTDTAPVEDRPVWPAAQRPDAAETQEPLFVEEPALAVLRHEVESDTPARFEKSQTGAFLIMGGVGLLASAFSAAAFRLALEEPSPMGETTVVAWTLAVIGGVCVVVSSLNLYMRWGRARKD